MSEGASLYSTVHVDNGASVGAPPPLVQQGTAHISRATVDQTLSSEGGRRRALDTSCIWTTLSHRQHLSAPPMARIPLHCRHGSELTEWVWLV